MYEYMNLEPGDKDEDEEFDPVAFYEDPETKKVDALQDDPDWMKNWTEGISVDEED